MRAGWRSFVRGLRALLHRDAADRDVADEVRHYLDEAAAAHRARGLPEEEARRAARVELGSVTGVNEQVRASGWENIVRGVAMDVRYAARRLRAERGFTAVTVLTLALGIGATTAIVSAVNPVLFEPLPYPDGHRIATLLELSSDGARIPGTFGMYRALADRNRSFEALSVLKPWQPTLTGHDEAERLEGQRVSAEYFHVLGVLPALGRTFNASDDQRGGPDVVILGDGLWRRRFHADPSILGREITLNDTRHAVIGIMPRGFENVLSPAAELWAPLQYDISEGRAWGHHLRTIGRLRAGLGADAATREVAALGNAVLIEQRPPTYGTNVVFAAVPLRDEITRGVKPALLAILAAVGLVLVIASVNVTNLVLARGVQRRHEFALRAALGAGRGRLARQLLTENLLLAAAGGAAGMAVALAGLRALVASSPPGLPRAGAIVFDSRAFAFGLAITAAAGIASGLIPALHAARSDPHGAMQHGSPRTAGGHGRLRGALVVIEIALALVLLVSSGLLLRSLQRLFAVPAGFESSGILTMQIQASGRRFEAPGASRQFFSLALEAARRVPGVTAAALTSQLPLSADRDEYGVHFDGSRAGYSTFRYAVTPGYIEALGIPLLRGRSLDARDRAGAPRVALINESFARRRFGTADPVGQRLRIGPADGPLFTIAGVVGDVRQVSLALDPPDAVYTTLDQWLFPEAAMSLIVRARGDAAGLAAPIRDAIQAVDRDQPIVRVAMLAHTVAASAAERRFALILVEAFALAALVLAAAGIYGIVAGRVAERTREIGVRAALGATRGNILGLVLRHGFILTAAGMAIGVPGAAAAGKGIGAMLFGVSPGDAATYAAVLVLLPAVSAIACAVPAWRAARVDPASTLRAE